MMWDFSHSPDPRRSRSRSPQPPPYAMSSSPQAPSFPIPHTNGPSPSPYPYSGHMSSSYPPAMPGYGPFITLGPHDVYPIPSPRHSQPSPTIPGSYPQPHVIHVIHHSAHHSKHDTKKKSKARSGSIERGGHSPHLPSHKLSHSFSTSQLNQSLSAPRPIPFPKAPSHPGTYPHHQRTPSQPNTPAQVHYSDLPAVSFERQPSTSNVLQKRRPAISLSGTQQIIHPQLTPHSPNTLQLPTPQKPLHGILKNKNSTQQLVLNANFQYSKCTGRKKAVCIGINYTYQPNVLRGCVNDARRVRDFLVKQGGYRSSEIYLLTDEPPKGTKEWDSRLVPTKENILRAMRWLVRDARKDDSLFLHYSGHGGQTRDLDGDEVDGQDEVIYPVDFRTAGFIIDDELHDILVKPLPAGCRLTGLFDACHSGTVLDLPYIYSSHGRLKGSHISSKSRRSKATPADVISWTSCLDDQTSSDTFAGGVAVGAMSYAFVTSLTQNPQQTYQDLLRSLRLILHPRFIQKPQLGSSHHIDTNLQFVF